jgi:hypothetical protein
MERQEPRREGGDALFLFKQPFLKNKKYLYHFVGRASSDPRTSYKAPPITGSTASQYHHTGDQEPINWILRRHQNQNRKMEFSKNKLPDFFFFKFVFEVISKLQKSCKNNKHTRLLFTSYVSSLFLLYILLLSTSISYIYYKLKRMHFVNGGRMNCTNHTSLTLNIQVYISYNDFFSFTESQDSYPLQAFYTGITLF